MIVPVNLESIQADLSALFAAAHRFKHDARRVVFWYDADAQFGEVFAALELSGVQKVLHDGAWFKLKYDLHRTFADMNVLVYAPFPEPLPRFNDVYDVQATGLKFSADRANMVFSRLGLLDKSLEGYLKAHERFLSAQGRVDALVDLGVPANADVAALRVAMLCAIAKVAVLDAQVFVRRLLRGGTQESGNALWLELQKFFEPSELWDTVFLATGYADAGGQPTLGKLFNALSVTHLRRRWALSFPASLEHFVLRPDALAVATVQSWLDSREVQGYKDLAAVTQGNLRIAELANDAGADALRDADSFAALEQAVLRDCVEALLARRTADARRWSELRTRSGWHWEAEYGEFYAVIAAATRFLESTWDALPATAAALWALYESSLHRVDAAYREFCAAFAPLESRGAELLKPLSDFVERVYIEDYLERLGEAWSDALTSDAVPFLPAPLATQGRFFNDVVRPALEKSRVAVVISDALRFEIGAALLEDLKLEDGLEASLSARATGLPSVTKSGMAALLPGSRLELNASGVVLRDGLPTNTTLLREAVLKSAVPSARAVQESDLTGQKRDEARAWLQSCELVYIYHNVIDTTGEAAALELDVPLAAAQALTDLRDLVKRLLKQLNVTQVFVTADHGFLFQRRKLESLEKLRGDSSGELLESSKRYTVGRGLTAVDGAQRFSSILEGLEVTVPRGSLRFVTPGAGAQYVHGGASLQETMIPVLSVRVARGRSAALSKVSVALQHSGPKRITGSPFTVTLAQLEPMSADLQPRNVRVAWFDSSHAPVTEELRLTFDSSAALLSERIQRHTVRLTLNAPDRLRDYTLVIRDADDDAELLRELWRIDLAIPDDFGI